MTVDYLSHHGYSARNLLIHYGSPSQGRAARAWYARANANFEKILHIYCDNVKSEFVGFTVDTRLARPSYRPIARSLRADTLTAQFVIPTMLNPTPEALLGGAVFTIFQNDGPLFDEVTRLFVRPSAPLYTAKAAMEKRGRTVKEAVIFGRPEHNHGQERSKTVAEVLRLLDTSSLERLILHNLDLNMLSTTMLPATMKTWAFLNNQDDCNQRAFSPYTEIHVLDQLLAAQKSVPQSGGLQELMHLQSANWNNIVHTSAIMVKLAQFVQLQPHLSVLCIHQKTAYAGRMVDLALPSLRKFSYNVSSSKLKEFADQGPAIRAWGGNFIPIWLLDHQISEDIDEQIDAIVVSDMSVQKAQLSNYRIQDALKNLRTLDTVALFTPSKQEDLSPADIHKIGRAVTRILRAFDAVGVKTEWVHVVYRDVQAWFKSLSLVSQDITTFRAARRVVQGLVKTRVKHVEELPEHVFEVRRKLGADIVQRYHAFEKQELGELHVDSQALADHREARNKTRKMEKEETKKRRSQREMDNRSVSNGNTDVVTDGRKKRRKS